MKKKSDSLTLLNELSKEDQTVQGKVFDAMETALDKRLKQLEIEGKDLDRNRTVASSESITLDSLHRGWLNV